MCWQSDTQILILQLCHPFLPALIYLVHLLMLSFDDIHFPLTDKRSSNRRMSSPGPIETIDPDGDLILSVSGSATLPHHLIRVSSQLLCRASPVFNIMFRTSRSSPPWPDTKKLDGDYHAIVILLNIIHLRTPNVPTEVTVDMLYKIAILSDRYNVAGVFVSWVKTWTDRYDDFTTEPGYERWLAISYVFRLGSVFTEVTKKLVMNSSLDKQSGLVTVGKYDAFKSGVMPDNVVGMMSLLQISGRKISKVAGDSIRLARQEVLRSIASICKDELKSYTSAGHNICNTGRYDTYPP